MTVKLAELLKDSNYKLSQFKQAQIDALEKRITINESGKKPAPYVVCSVRGKPIKLTAEEAVRQLYLMVLMDDLGYPAPRIELEYGVVFGRERKRADICVFDKDKTTTPYILVELKKPKLKDGKEQLKSYCNATGAPMGVWSNGEQISFYHRKDPNYFEDIPTIPSVREKLSDILSERWTIDDLVKKDKLANEKKSLKDLILEMEDEVLANAGVDVFEELFKLIFTKLFDEMESGRDKKRHLIFKNYGDTESELKAKIQDLFDKARSKWEGVFPLSSKIDLTPSHLAVCVSSLEGVKLFNSNLDVVDEAFEYLINKSSKGEKGQYFTPRYVIDMCVKMLNPQEHENLIDTAAGSCGFPVHGIFHVWEQIIKDLGLSKSHLLTSEKKDSPRFEKYVQEKVFAIDFDEKAVRVGRTLNLIAGDGQTNVLHLNALDYERWDEKTKDEAWTDIYGEGWKKLRKLRLAKDQNRDFGFDVLMANPPFAGDIKETRILAKYELARSASLEKVANVAENNPNIVIATNNNQTFPEFLRVKPETIYKMADGTFRKVKHKENNNLGRDILFIERNLSFLKPGGRMAVVLPQGRFNNSSDKDIREYLADKCRLLAVVGLHGNVFKPHTNTKTSVLFVQKWNDEESAGALCPRKNDYPIFYATMLEPSKDNSGNKIYLMGEDGQPVLDEHGHLIVKHDLFNHDGKTQDGIAEAFQNFAKTERLSFVRDSFANPKFIAEGVNIKSFEESFIASGRLDAEHYQRKYEYLEEKISTKHKVISLGKLLALNQRGGQPEYGEQGLPVVNSRHVREGEVVLTDNRYAELSSKKNGLCIQKGDVLINGTGVGTIGRSACYLHEQNALPDNHVTVLRTNKINPMFLSVYLNSVAGQYQVEKHLSGSSGQIELYPKDINQFYVPVLSDDSQNNIADLVKKSFLLKAESERLLEVAKRAVEIAIEQDEQAGLDYIKKESKQ